VSAPAVRIVRLSAVIVVVIVVNGVVGGGGVGAPATARADDKPKAAVVERVAAVVNNSVILETEVAQHAIPLVAEAESTSLDSRQREQQMKTAMRQAVDLMVDEELVLQAAAEAKLEVNEDEVVKAMDDIKRQNKVTDRQLEDALKRQGYTIPEYKKDLRRQILRLRAINVLVRPRVQVSDGDIRTHYDKIAGQSATVTQVHLRHILVGLSDKPSTDEMDAARKKAGDLVARARAGEDFAKLAQTNSEDTTTKSSGGDLGWYKRNELPTEWEEIVFAMNTGEVRGPVRGPRGLHVFQVIENKKEEVRPFEEVKEQLREKLFNAEMEKQTKVWLQELRKRAHIEVKM
jgi:peptidyl-prolyl cis-trans isomerase SurA